VVKKESWWTFPKFVILAAILGVVIGVFGLGEKLGDILGLWDRKVEVMIMGDVMLGRSVNTTAQRRGDWKYPFLKTSEELFQADLTLGNLETPLVPGCKNTDTGMIFCGNPKMVEGLKLAGFDVLSLANNHIFNYGRSGFEETEELVESEQIVGVGEGEIEEVEVKGVKLAFLAFDDVSNRVNKEKMIQLIKEAKERNEVVMVSMHWGWEYRSAPNLRQIDLGRGAIDAGANVVWGHHPHWVQSVEEYNGGYIFYSLGNFVFDQMWSEKTREGVVARVVMDREGVEEYELLPVRIYDYSQPKWVE